MTYTRVIPRDLFNEAKLLKCLGQLSLLIHEGKGIRWPMVMEIDETHDGGFTIDQNENDGGIYCVNVGLKVRDRHVHLQTGLNSRSPYPLEFEFGDDSGLVFTDAGQFSEEFIAFLDSFEADDEEDADADDCPMCGGGGGCDGHWCPRCGGSGVRPRESRDGEPEDF